jgi:Na+/H+ antiporter NhaD/arsenite permease-like protein
MLDLRLPMGLMFSLVGVMMMLYGLFTWGGEQYAQHSLGRNVNLWWGLVLLAFGLAMLGLARWAAAVEKSGDGK